MANISKKFNKHVESIKRYQYWNSSENADDGTPIAAGDVFQIATTLGKPAHYIYLETEAGCTLTIRLNSQIVRFPLRDLKTHWALPSRKLESPITETDSTMAPIPVSDGVAQEIWEFNGVIPVSDIQIVTFSGNDFELFVA
jgi:hypothetical protein